MSSKEISHWQFHLDQIDQEGISTKAYAAREGLSLQSLYQWRHELKRRRADDPVSLTITPRVSRQFVELRPCLDSSKDGSASEMSCRLILPSGVRLEMSDLPSIGWITALAHELGGLGVGQR